MSKPLSPLRYPGGKSRAVGKFIKYLPQGITSICSPFFGGGSFELFCLMNYGIKILGYDLFEPLVAFWNCLLEDPERLTTIVSRFLPVVTKDLFYALQKRFLQIEDRWERAAALYILNRTSFSGSTVSGGFSPLDQKGRNGRFHEGNIEFLRNFCVPNGLLNVQHLSFEESILLRPEVFIYADPPYIVDSRLYGNRGDLHDIDHELLAGILRSRGNWMLSYNECGDVRRLYRDFYFVDSQDGLSWQYGMSKSKASKELLILSSDVAERLELPVRKPVRRTSLRSIQQGVPPVGQHSSP